MQRLLFRQCDANYPFLWEDGSRQPAQRWNKSGEGPAQYFADSPEAAWAEFIRHEEILDPVSAEDMIKDFRRILWAVEVEVPASGSGLYNVTARDVSGGNLFGDESSYAVCQDFAEQVRTTGVEWLQAPSAAMLPDSPTGYTVGGGKLNAGPTRDFSVFVYFGKLPNAVGWKCSLHPFCDEDALRKIRRLKAVSAVTS